MPVRVLPTDRIHHHIDKLFAAGWPLPEILGEVARLGYKVTLEPVTDINFPARGVAVREEALTTNPDHNRIRHEAILADSLWLQA